MIEFALFTDLVDYSAFFFEVIGAIYIIYGGTIAGARLLMRELRIAEVTYADVRIGLAHKLAFGLEFLIAADVLMTIMTPSPEDILLLGGIVVIRVILGYFLAIDTRQPLV